MSASELSTASSTPWTFAVGPSVRTSRIFSWTSLRISRRRPSRIFFSSRYRSLGIWFVSAVWFAMLPRLLSLRSNARVRNRLCKLPACSRVAYRSCEDDLKRETTRGLLVEHSGRGVLEQLFRSRSLRPSPVLGSVFYLSHFQTT